MTEFMSQNQRVGHLERERAENFLQESFAQGRITEEEFESRIDRVLNARTRGDLNGAFTDLVPITAQYLGSHPAYRKPTPARGSADVPGAKGIAGIAHALPFISWIFGPALIYAVSAPGTYARREAAKSFNWTLISSLSFLVLAVASGALPFIPSMLVGFAWVAWVVLTVIGAVKAFGGEDWRNPLMRIMPWKPLSEK